MWIEQEIRSDHYPNSRTIAERFEISPKTAQRTLDFMRDRLNRPLAYSSEKKGWYYSEPAYPLPGIDLTEGDLVAILLAERLVQQYKGTAIARQVEQAFDKVIGAMTDRVSIDLGSLAEAYSFEAPATSQLDPKIFSQLGMAASNRHQIEMTYYTANRGEVTRRRADPLHLRNYLGEWYLIAFDHLRRGVRDFHAGRIRELKITEETFDWPKGFDLGAYLKSGFAMIRGQEPFEVEIIFDEYQARWIRERSLAHPTEQREEMPDGSLRVRMRVTALDGVKRFVLQYGSHARVIGPEKLLQETRDEIEAMLALYSDVTQG